MSVKDNDQQAVNITQKKILIIDGHPVYIYKLEGFLKGLSLSNVSLAHSGKEGLRLAESIRPDLVLLSGMLPDIDSRKLCKELKAALPQTRIIVQVGLFTEMPVIEQFKEFGASAVLARKEKDLSALQQHIEKLLA